ncbi:glycosyltransferase family 2 protein [Aneurinibacillus danicus]|uniref:Glycosyltransferase 2-like domain-containing protein n=1 Tax=Aneurinibacillus danicus TaxID=267746 RepID=A0A511V883_9BACL|nr:glycosyltransferase family 2 protein [Aneurinibacillus danicus]GEN35147.1 hypothetical protein ADA01nite_26070 [Aneurinibacillus danicus]
MGVLSLFYKVFDKKRIYTYKTRIPQTRKIFCILRVRNEELIIEDTLNHLAKFSDAIICYDDASTDRTFDLLSKHPKVICIIKNFKWKQKPEERIKCETSDRLQLLKLAKQFNPEWIFCADADERYMGNIREFVCSESSKEVSLVRISLFDAYLTPNDHAPYKKGQPLLNLRKYFGPERRDIIMLWRANEEGITFLGDDSREPIYPKSSKVKTLFKCQHYGKALSIQHWEETCNYYIKHFPYIPYGEKWEKRKGKAIHTISDFGTPLYQWGKELFSNAVIIHGGFSENEGEEKDENIAYS